MHTEVEFAVEPKPAAGKGAARKLRAQGKVPGIVYGPGMQPVMISFTEKDLVKALSTSAARNVFLRVRASGHDLDGSRLIIKDLQVHPVRRAFVHVDFYKPDPTKMIHASVPMRIEGTAAGVKLGGILQVTLREVVVACLPDQLPEAIAVDVTELRPGHSIHVGDLTPPEGVRILTDSRLSVCAVIGASGYEEGGEAAAGPAAE
ncbi:MAG: 50S ribosomal protein L25 [Deltaproteobacteria bacterium]|nr:50S ribosomal protein L25 [Deltaproteobacteria bacterium]